jgi:hypothetical protein
MPQCQFLFFAVFLFQIFTKGNILRIGQNEARSPYFDVTYTESKEETEEGTEAATPCGGVPPGRAWSWCGRLGRPPTSSFCLYIASDAKTLNKSASIHKRFHSAAAIEDQFRGTEVSVLAPCRDRELPPEPSPSTPPPSSSPLLTPMMRRE